MAGNDEPTTAKRLEHAPGGLTGLLRLGLPALPVVNLLPGIRKNGDDPAGLAYARESVEVGRETVDAYARVCGFPRRDTVPITYPHLLAFPLHTAIMADRQFPWPAVGMVHVDNTITTRRRIEIGEQVDVHASVGSPRRHDKGALVDFVTVVSVEGRTVWESTSSYLRRGAEVAADAAPAVPLDLPPAPEGGLTWRLPGDLGRRYAAVSGDHNPIHLHPLTAKAFGFPRHIAHGMWSKARCLAAIENRLPDAVRVEVGFKRPVLLPGQVRFSHRAHDGIHEFALTSPSSGAPHLVGRAVPADPV